MKKEISWNIFSENRNIIYGIAIISIMIFHYVEDCAINGSGGVFVKVYGMFVGSIGVEAFLFLSGISLYFSMQKNHNIRRFYKNRIKRVLIPSLLVMTCYWIILDILIRGQGLLKLLYDLTFISFWTSGVRTFWYVQFLFIGYIAWPLVYHYLNLKVKDCYKLIGIICMTGMLSVFIKQLSPMLYNNTEVLFNRSFVFLLGGMAGKKVYYKCKISAIDFIFLNVGLVFKMLSIFFPLSWISINGFRIISCFYGITVLFYTSLIFKKIKKGLFKKAMLFFGKSSFEFYLTHVAVRELMKNIGIQTYKLSNYLICIALSFVITYMLNLIKSINLIETHE